MQEKRQIPLFGGENPKNIRVLLLVNPCAGRMRGAKYADNIEAWLRESGVYVERFDTTETENGAAKAAAAGKSFTRICCIGGDGTLNAVMNGVLSAGADLPITYIPAGTTNDFAQTLRIPKRSGAMRAAIESGRDMYIDAGRLNAGYFSYVASFGAFTKCSYATPRVMKRLLGHLAYVLEGMRDIAALKSYDLTVQGDGKLYSGAYAFGAFSNTASIGGMVRYKNTLVDMHDGKLEMLLIRKPETLPELHRLVRCLSASEFDDPLFEFASCASFTVQSEQPLDWSVDGEHVIGTACTEVACVHDAVRVTVPHTGE